jgi:hypothetical protein
LRKNAPQISNEYGAEQENDLTPSVKLIFSHFRNVAHAYRVVKQMRCRAKKGGCLFGYTERKEVEEVEKAKEVKDGNQSQDAACL